MSADLDNIENKIGNIKESHPIQVGIFISRYKYETNKDPWELLDNIKKELDDFSNQFNGGHTGKHNFPSFPTEFEKTIVWFGKSAFIEFTLTLKSSDEPNEEKEDSDNDIVDSKKLSNEM